MKKKILLFLTCLTTLISTPVYAAYDDTYEWAEDAVLVDNDAKHDNNKITFYYIRSNDSQMSGKFSFDFKELSENIYCRYENWLENAKVIEQNENYKVILYRFTVEDGTYAFSANMSDDGIYVLTPDFKDPRSLGGDTGTYQTFPVELSDHDEMSLYAISGNDEFINEYMDDLITYATDRETALEEAGGGNINNSTTEIANTGNTSGLTEEEEQTIENTINEISETLNMEDDKAETVSDKTDSIVTVKEEKTEEKKEESSFEKIYTYVLLVLFFIFLIVMGVFKKRK